MKRKRISVRKVSENNEKSLYDFDFQQAYDYFLSAKKSEGLREKTLISYDEHFRFFTNWLKEFRRGIQKVSDVSSFLLREYMIYMRDEHMNFKTKEIGLSPQTINARIRFLKNFYNLLFKEQIIETNPVESVRFLKIDETPFQPLTTEEMKCLFNTPDVKNFPQFRDYILMNLLYDSGMRINEAINLVVSELDIKAKRIILPAIKNKTRVGHSQISTTRKYVRFDEQMIKNQHELYSPVMKLRQKFKR